MAIHNFASSAAPLPASVIEAISSDIIEWRSSGQSVFELPFTGSEFGHILAEAERNLRALLKLPDDFHVLFLQGGASTQFALLPMNLLGLLECAAYEGHSLLSCDKSLRRTCERRAPLRGGYGNAKRMWRRPQSSGVLGRVSTNMAAAIRTAA